MIRFKHNSKARITTTNNYESAVLINRIGVKSSLLVLHNTDNTNAAMYKVYASLEQSEPELDVNSSNTTWYELVNESILNPQDRVAYTLTDPWNFLLIQVKSSNADQHATLNIYSSDVL